MPALFRPEGTHSYVTVASLPRQKSWKNLLFLLLWKLHLFSSVKWAEGWNSQKKIVPGKHASENTPYSISWAWNRLSFLLFYNQRKKHSQDVQFHQASESAAKCDFEAVIILQHLLCGSSCKYLWSSNTIDWLSDLVILRIAILKKDGCEMPLWQNKQ